MLLILMMNNGLKHLTLRRRPAVGYAGAVTWVDSQVGKLLDALEASGSAWNETVIVLFGDHGWALGEHGIFCKQANFELEVRRYIVLS